MANIRKEILDVVAMGPFPASDVADPDDIDRRGAALDQIKRPVSTDEALLLIQCFGADDCFGLGWTLLHIIETAPHLPIMKRGVLDRNEWLQITWKGPREGVGEAGEG